MMGMAPTYPSGNLVPKFTVSAPSSVSAMERAPTVINNGRAITIGLSVVLAASVFLPNGSYRSGSAVVSINALAAPFEDYGSTEFGIGVIVMLIVGALWATRWRPQHSEFGTVAA